ncbi:MAG: hypothetical protein H6735_14020 [Alphaproteobacteria bacterium]|nr:hypothetical protein [Alphaproteobacteria bacterium]
MASLLPACSPATTVVVDLSCVMPTEPEDPPPWFPTTCEGFATVVGRDLLLDDCGDEATDLCVAAQSLAEFCADEFGDTAGCPPRTAWAELGFGHARSCPGNDGQDYSVLSADRGTLLHHFGYRADAVFRYGTNDLVFVRIYEQEYPMIPEDWPCCDLDGVGDHPESYVWGAFVHLDCAWPQRHVFLDPT